MIRFTILTLLLVSSCGKSGKGSSQLPVPGNTETSESRPTPSPAPSTPTYGKYRALLTSRVIEGPDPVIGTTDISFSPDQFAVNLHVEFSQKISRQFIHHGKSCPDLTLSEAKILIPLDEDLSTQEAGEDLYPQRSRYTYRNEARTPALLADLHKVDTDESDEVVKLAPDETLKLEDYFVVLSSMMGNEEMVVGCGQLTLIPDEN
jgi:hypothetical protein